MLNLTSIIGKYGNGKSLYMLELGLKMANEFQKPLVCNFRLNHSAVREYCKAQNLKWFAVFGFIKYVDLSQKSVFDMLRPDSVVLLDEAGVFLNARNWSKVDSRFLERLPRLRHFNIHLICGFQFFDQVDKNIRDQCQHWIVCEGIAKYDKKLKLPRLYARFCHHYDTDKFDQYCFDVNFRTNGFKRWLSSLKVRWAILAFGDLKFFFLNMLAVVRWYYGFMRSQNKSKYCRFNSFKELKSIERHLFECYRSDGFGESKRLPVMSANPIYVSDGLDSPVIIKKIKFKKHKRSA